MYVQIILDVAKKDYKSSSILLMEPKINFRKAGPHFPSQQSTTSNMASTCWRKLLFLHMLVLVSLSSKCNRLIDFVTVTRMLHSTTPRGALLSPIAINPMERSLCGGESCHLILYTVLCCPTSGEQFGFK